MIEAYLPLFLLLLGCAIFIWFTTSRKMLTQSGALLAVAIGLWILYQCGDIYLIPLFFFFISSTLLGKMLKVKEVSSDQKHGKPRDAFQVFCNGGIYALLPCFVGWSCTTSFSIELAMFASLSVSTADTWASEIGIFLRGRTYDILRFQPIAVGASGGVSLGGTLGGLLGAICLGGLGMLYYRLDNPFYNGFYPLVLAGFIGMLLDSVLGALVQARYLNPETGAITDVPVPGARLYSGVTWLTNDWVNLISNVLVSGFVLWLGTQYR
ncbi:MAG: DUF92 domain-containing protein [Saprospiraceae bacterium]|nr:DUF92 domain-containing protein [Saprospiraceae bacterium]